MSSNCSEWSFWVVMMSPDAEGGPGRGPRGGVLRGPGRSATWWMSRGSVRGLLEQRLQRRMGERLLGGGVVQHLLERRVHALGLDDLRHGEQIGRASCRERV